MKKTIWLSYDLGVKGNYEALYSWLDNASAKECGDSVAVLKYEASSAEEMLVELKADLERSVDFNKTDRIYVAFRADDSTLKGRFIIGKRKAAPWQGYGDVESEDDI